MGGALAAGGFAAGAVVMGLAVTGLGVMATGGAGGVVTSAPNCSANDCQRFFASLMCYLVFVVGQRGRRTKLVSMSSCDKNAAPQAAL